jgi:hypothetical protein
LTGQETPDEGGAAFGVAAWLALITAIDMARSGFLGRGGALALSSSGVFAAAAVLLWTGPSNRVRSPGENTVAQLLRRSTMFAFAGHVCIAARLGFISLLAVPVYWLSVPLVIACVFGWIGLRMWTSLTAGGDRQP